MHSFFRLIPLVLFILITSACVNTTSVRHSPNYAQQLSQKNLTAVFTPSALVHTENASYQKERQYDYEYYVEDRLRDMLSDELSNRGYNVSNISNADLKDEEFYNIKDDIHNSAEKIKKNLYRKEMLMDVKQAHTVNESLSNYNDELAAVLESDVLLFSGFNETVKTTGAQTRDFAINFAIAALAGNHGSMQIDPGEHASFYAGLFDAKDGQLLWMNTVADASASAFNISGFGKDEKNKTDEKLSRLTKLLLEPLPKKNNLNTAQDLLDKAAEERQRKK